MRHMRLAVAVMLVLGAFSANADPILEQVAPVPTDYVFNVDFTTMVGSGIGTADSIAEAIDWSLGLGNGSTSGCELADFAGFTAGNIAILQRGACFFREKVENAILAGAIGAIIFNQGNTAERFGLVNGTLLDPVLAIPVLFATHDVGVGLDGARVLMSTVPEPGTLALLGIGLFGIGLLRRRKTTV